MDVKIVFCPVLQGLAEDDHFPTVKDMKEKFTRNERGRSLF